jgi:hypothetical protein
MPGSSFERRTFLKLIGAGLGAGLLANPRLLKAQAWPVGVDPFEFILYKPKWILHEDGTFDIYAGTIRLTRCRPTINGQSIFVRNTFVGDSPKGKRIIYEIDGGFVMLDLRTHSDAISIGAEISGMSHAPAWFNPLGEGALSGATHFYRLGPGTGGQSGIFEIRRPTETGTNDYPDEEAWSYDSFMMTGLVATNGDTLAIGAFEQTDFIQRSSIFNHPRRLGLQERRKGGEAVFFEAGFSTEGIPLKNEFIRLPDLFIYFGNRPFGTMQTLAWSISDENQARRDTDTNYFWTSYQDFRTAFSYKYLLDQLNVLDEMNPPLHVQTVQVGKGYCVTGDWLDTNDLWPKTMEDVARQIFQRKYRAGIYVAPFSVHQNSRIFRNHPHWILKDKAGSPIVMDEDIDGKLYALDGSHDDVQHYIARVFRTFRKMGFTYFELDDLDWGLQDPTGVTRFRNGQSSVQVFRDVMALIREEIGAGSFITANQTPYSPVVGFVDAVRIDRDQSWDWRKETTGHLLNESYHTQFFNNVLWQNDPDVVFLRSYKTEFTNVEKKSLALWVGFVGGAVGISDNFKVLDSDMLELWRFIEPARRPEIAVLPYWGKNMKNKVAVRRYKKLKTWGVLVLNDSEQTVTETYLVQELIGREDAWIFAWEPGFSLGLGKSNQLRVVLDSHEARLYYLSGSKQNPSLNLTIAGREVSLGSSEGI